MLETALIILNKIENSGFKAYIVGGFVRDHILGVDSSDVDISTNATPMQIKEIFPNIFLPNENYGSITVIYNKVRFEITTFRKEYDYINNRKPSKVVYIDNLVDDLKRRDFTINTLCIDSKGKIVDPLNNQKDIDNRIINTVSDSVDSFNEDALRILRAVRFATTLDFNLSEEVIKSIQITKGNLMNISYVRKKSELDKIFTSGNAEYGIDLLIKLGLDKELEIYNMSDIKLSNDLLGIWSSLDVTDKYPFTRAEKELIEKIKCVSKYNNLNVEILYKYGPYVNSIAAINKGMDNTNVVDKYNSLPIKTRKDIDVTSEEIIKIFNKFPGKFIDDVYNDLEKKILNNDLENKKDVLKEYITKKYIGGIYE